MKRTFEGHQLLRLHKKERKENCKTHWHFIFSTLPKVRYTVWSVDGEVELLGILYESVHTSHLLATFYNSYMHFLLQHSQFTEINIHTTLQHYMHII